LLGRHGAATIAGMASVTCLDGTTLSVVPVPCLDRQGASYEMTLVLQRDGAPFGEVGQRCGHLVAGAAQAVRTARDVGGPDALPAPPAVTGRDRELLALRSRDPDDLPSTGELRVWLREEWTWRPGPDGGRGQWSTRSAAVLDAWGSGGTGVRAELSGTDLLQLLESLLAEWGGTPPAG